MAFQEGWWCVSEHDGLKNPLCDTCRSLMSSSGLRQAATPNGFVHSTELFTPPRYPYLWDLETFSCPLCKACYSLRNKSRQLCPQPAPSEGVKIFWHEDTKHLTLQISLDLRFYDRSYAGCSQDICILADQGMLGPFDGVELASNERLVLQPSEFLPNMAFYLSSATWLEQG